VESAPRGMAGGPGGWADVVVACVGESGWCVRSRSPRLAPNCQAPTKMGVNFRISMGDKKSCKRCETDVKARCSLTLRIECWKYV
jgi:hypothetical protein